MLVLNHISTEFTLYDVNILNTSDYFDTISKISDRIFIPILVDGMREDLSSINTIRMVKYEKVHPGMCLKIIPHRNDVLFMV